MNKTEAIAIIKSKKFFSCEFKKQNGEIRKLVGRTGVHKYVKPGSEGLKYNPADMGYINVFDLQAKGYRTVNVQTLLKVNGKRVD